MPRDSRGSGAPSAWLVTGTIARETIEAMASKHEGIGLLVAPVSVASFITSTHVSKLLAGQPWVEDAVVIVPGVVKWDVEPGDEPPFIVKGPKTVDELDALCNHVSRILRKQPGISAAGLAKVLLEFQRAKSDNVARVNAIIHERARAFTEIERGAKVNDIILTCNENKAMLPRLARPGRNFIIPGTAIIAGKDFPPAIMAEIINAPEKPLDAIEAEARYFVARGADVVDVGATPGKLAAAALGRVVRHLIESVGCTTSIDSMQEEEIIAGVDNGARIVLSIDHGNIDVLDSLPRDVVLVLIPTNVKAGTIPADAGGRVEALVSLVHDARDRGFTKLLADPILNSPIVPGLMSALEAFIAFSNGSGMDEDDIARDVPLFIGGSNVSEMIDTDSTGVNAVLAIAGVELGAGMLFTTEDSAKCLGSVKEMRRGRDLAFHAMMQRTCPKDLGITAVNVKRKERFVSSFVVNEAIVQVVPGASGDDGTSTYTPDPSGIYVKIMVEHPKDRIVAGLFQGTRLVRAFEGKSAETMGKAIMSACTLTPEHLLYIGRELAKASFCLHHDIVYVQDA